MVRLKWFDDSDFKMDGVGVSEHMNDDFLIKLDAVRDLCGFPFIVTSSYRTPEKNRQVGGAPNSMHLYGRAVDVKCDNGIQRGLIARHALNMGLSVGVMRDGVHLDDRPDQIVFHYYNRYKSGASENE